MDPRGPKPAMRANMEELIKVSMEQRARDNEFERKANEWDTIFSDGSLPVAPGASKEEVWKAVLSGPVGLALKIGHTVRRTAVERNLDLSKIKFSVESEGKKVDVHFTKRETSFIPPKPPEKGELVGHTEIISPGMKECLVCRQWLPVGVKHICQPRPEIRTN